MSDFLLRDDAPLSPLQWAELDRVVSDMVKRHVVCRRFLSLYGPLGSGVQVIPTDRFPELERGQIDMVGQHDDPVSLSGRVYQKIPLLHKDFVLFWRDLESSNREGIPTDWSMAEAAASFLANLEDELVIHGHRTIHIDGLTSVKGRQTFATEGWMPPDSGYQDVVKAVTMLTTQRFFPPFTVLVGTTGYAAWHRLFGNSGVLEIDQIRKLVQGGVFVTPLLADSTMLVMAAGSENLDIAVGVDATVAFLESSSMNHWFRVLETLTVRIKRPAAICHVHPVLQ